MAGLLRGLIGLAPQIVDAVSSVFNQANEGYSYAKDEFKVLKGQYDHTVKKLKAIGRIVGVPTDTLGELLAKYDDENDLYVVDEKKLIDLEGHTYAICSAYEELMQDKVIPLIIKRYFTSSDRMDEVLDDYKPPLQGSLGLLNTKALQAVLWTSKLSSFSKYTLSMSPHHSQASVVVIDKLISDSILAFSRVFPDRYICPTNCFWILPNKHTQWNVPKSNFEFKYVKYLRMGDKSKLYIGWKRESYLYIKKYYELYKFKVRVKLSKVAKLDADNQIRDMDIETIEIELPVDSEESEELFTVLEHKEVYDDSMISVSNLELIGTVVDELIPSFKVSSLHGIDIKDFTYGSLLVKGKYELEDPAFSIHSIFHNSIGTAQFTIQTTITLFAAWIEIISQEDNTVGPMFSARYSSKSSKLNYLEFCSISNYLVKTKYFDKMEDLAGLTSYMSQLIKDLDFMSHFISRSKSGKRAIRAVLKSI